MKQFLTILTSLLLLTTSAAFASQGKNVPRDTDWITANPTTVSAGGTTTLTWGSTGMDTCALDNPINQFVSVSGSEQSPPIYQSTLFVLNCRTHGHEYSSGVYVTVQ